MPLSIREAGAVDALTSDFTLGKINQQDVAVVHK
jgi:hypothetical protein